MAYAHYDRLSALDASFLAYEAPNVHMHVGSVAIFDGAPLLTPTGELDIERIRGLAGPALRRSARFRQRAVRVPWFQGWVWVDDPGFNLDYHLRHTAIPEPGNERQLKRLAGRIFSQKLDLERPLWEMWFVEGLEGGRVAVISKIHHAVIDGMSGASLLAGWINAGEQADAIGSTDPRWMPRPAPDGLRLALDEAARRLIFPARAWAAGWRALADPAASLREARRSAAAVGSLLRAGLAAASNTPLNAEIGPYRRFDCLRMDLDAMKRVRSHLGGTVNDVVIALVAGAMRRFLRLRGVPVETLDFRAMLPVNVRREEHQRKLGNRVATLVAKLPLDEDDPLARLRRVVETTRELKASDLVEGGELLEALSDAMATSLIARLANLATRSLAYNLVVTNVPGPPFALNLLGAKMEAIYPLVPLFRNQALGIALFSYAGTLHWGLNADWDLVPDLHRFVELLKEEFDRLLEAELPLES
jgi:WS/DGAT/MGAT family acyltransferase